MLGRVISRFAGLRIPTLFKVCAALFLVELVVPDVIPFADKILLALLTLPVGAFRERSEASPAPPPEATG